MEIKDTGAIKTAGKLYSASMEAGGLEMAVGSKFYYIWFDEKKAVPCVVFLSTSEESFLDYIEILKNRYKDIKISPENSLPVEKNILDFLSGRKKGFDFNCCFLTGTGFEKKVWIAAAQIGYGKVKSYMEIAELAGSPNAWRAAGTALGNNPIMLAVSCHRVIKSSGEIGLYGGGEKMKRYLLQMEAGHINSGKQLPSSA
jgi:O-6-methylguanine DNA methyltransferase